MAARRFATRRALDPDERAVVLSAFVHSAILSPVDADWRAASVSELERFRAVRRSRGGSRHQQVDFVDQRDWPESWLSERRLYVVYVPRSGTENELRRDYGESSYLQTCCGELTSDVETVCKLTFVNVYRRVAPSLWKGSVMEIHESDRALELKGIGGNFTEKTVVNADVSLAAPTFDWADGVVRGEGTTGQGEERVWLAIGLPIEADTPLPAPRPVGRDEVLDDPVRIKRAAARLSLQVLRAKHLTSGSLVHARMIASVMAVERH